jgi:hypothetical protein
MTVAIGERARVNLRTRFASFRFLTDFRFLAGLFALAATAVLVSACQGSSGRIDNSYWRSMYGDPDTMRPDSGSSMCCRHAGRDSNH